jgi:hypothetical protein
MKRCLSRLFITLAFLGALLLPGEAAATGPAPWIPTTPLHPTRLAPAGFNHDSGVGRLRDDLPALYQSSAYLTSTALGGYAPTGVLIANTAGIHIETSPEGPGNIEVGLWETVYGITWYAYSDNGAQVIRGTAAFGSPEQPLGCIGALNDLGTAADTFVTFQLARKFPGSTIWVASVWDAMDPTPTVVCDLLGAPGSTART